MHSRLQELNSLLSIGSSGVLMVGIFGIGGIGKTTLAKAIYNVIAPQFESSCFLSNVRENSKTSLVQLQETILFDLLAGENIRVGFEDRGINIIKHRLSHKRVLLVLDDVNHLSQLQKLAGAQDWFGLGSRIIITTRDKHLLNAHRAVQRIYNVAKLNYNDALQLFSWNAFGEPTPPKDFDLLSNNVLNYAGRLPLALVVLGSFLCDKNILEWESAFQKLKQIPNREIYEILKVSFDGLEDDEKNIFLDIACFFNGCEREYVTKILGGCYIGLEVGITSLVHKSLLSFEYGALRMHDLIQEMGREIVRQESPKELGKRSRLWFHEDILHVLRENTGSSKIEGIFLDLPEREMVHTSANAFNKMKHLRLLILHNADLSTAPEYLSNQLRLIDWHGCPLFSLPSSFRPSKMIGLSMPNGQIKQLGEGFKRLQTLKFLNFYGCKLLTEIPDFSTIPNLEELNLRKCTSLVRVHQSIGFHNKLVRLDLGYCRNLRSIPSSFKMKSLKYLEFRRCSRLKKFPGNVEKSRVIVCQGISKLGNVSETFKDDRRAMPSIMSPWSLASIDLSLPNLQELNLSRCNLSDLNFLTHLNASKLRSLDLSGNNFVSLPSCITRFANLVILCLANYEQLEEIPKLPTFLWLLRASSCKSLRSLSDILKLSFLTIDFSECEKLVANLGSNVTDIFCNEGVQMKEMFRIIFPANELPAWFSHCSNGNSISFHVPSQFYGRIVGLVLCAMFGLKDNNTQASCSCSIEFLVNGQRTTNTWDHHYHLCGPFESDHVCLGTFPRQILKKMEELLIGDWSHLEVRFRCKRMKRWGVHLVCRQDEQGGSPPMFPCSSACPHRSTSLALDEIDKTKDLMKGIPLTKRSHGEHDGLDFVTFT